MSKQSHRGGVSPPVLLPYSCYFPSTIFSLFSSPSDYFFLSHTICPSTCMFQNDTDTFPGT